MYNREGEQRETEGEREGMAMFLQQKFNTLILKRG